MNNLPPTITTVEATSTMTALKKDQQAPLAKKVPKTLSIHNHDREDPYFWLKEREDTAVIDYLKAENTYTEAVMKDTKTFQEKMYEEIIGRIKQTDESVPYLLRGYYYYTRLEEGKEYPIYCRKKGSLEAGKEEVLLNCNEMAEGHSYHNINGLSVTKDNKLLAFGEDTIGRRKYTIKVKNLETGEIYADEIPQTTGGVAWANDNKTFFYTVKEEVTLRSYKIFKHVLGTATSEDVEIFHEKDDTFGTFVYKTKSDRYIMVGSYATLSNEYRFIDADNPNGEFTIIQPRERELEYSVDHYGDHFYILHNQDAKNFKLSKTPVDKTTKENWEEVIPHRDDVLLEGIEIFKDFLVLNERKNGLIDLRIMRWDGTSEHYLDFGEPTYLAYTSRNPEFDTQILRYGYTSLTTPNSTYDYDMVAKTKVLKKQQEVIGDFDAKNYQSERAYVTVRDGEKVPVSIVYRKGMEKNGDNPVLLYAYGSYGSSTEAYFTSTRLSLLDRGFIWVIAHIRGGEEMGRRWYDDGKLLKKKNTFNDFVDCAKYLIDEKYTNNEKLFAMGGSAGGLLMGAVANMNPELFKGIIAAVPFVDVITTMLDDSIPLTTGEYDEWGNPNEKAYYDYILSYSPYDNVEAKKYPNMLITTGLHDSQVQYWEPAKWVAKLRDLKTDDNVLLLKTDMEAGHGGASGRFAYHKETALKYVFLLDLLGVKE